MDVNNGDPEDWPESWRELREIDTLLRCPICCEYMDTAMILSKCSHNYCSLCIRRSLSYKTQCPTCFVGATEGEMINNRSLDDVIQKFTLVRQKLLEVVVQSVQNVKELASEQAPKGPESPLPTHSSSDDTKNIPLAEVESRESVSSKSKRDGPEKCKLRISQTMVFIQSDDEDSDATICSNNDADDNAPQVHPSKTKSKESSTKLDLKQPSNLLTLSGSQIAAAAGSGTQELDSTQPLTSDMDQCEGVTSDPVQDIAQPSTSRTGTPDNSRQSMVRVPCPVCQVEIPEKRINMHLDRCLGNMKQTETRSVVSKRKQMPKLVYNLLSDKDLRKKCAEVGLSTQGDKQALIKRHHGFTLLYNSQCDSTKPKSAAELVKEMERIERAKAKSSLLSTSTTNKLVIPKGASSENVEKAQRQYAEQHKSQFSDLIANLRKRRMEKDQPSAKLENQSTSEGTTCSVAPSTNSQLPTLPVEAFSDDEKSDEGASKGFELQDTDTEVLLDVSPVFSRSSAYTKRVPIDIDVGEATQVLEVDTSEKTGKEIKTSISLAATQVLGDYTSDSDVSENENPSGVSNNTTQVTPTLDIARVTHRSAAKRSSFTGIEATQVFEENLADSDLSDDDFNKPGQKNLNNSNVSADLLATQVFEVPTEPELGTRSGIPQEGELNSHLSVSSGFDSPKPTLRRPGNKKQLTPKGTERREDASALSLPDTQVFEDGFSESELQVNQNASQVKDKITERVSDSFATPTLYLFKEDNLVESKSKQKAEKRNVAQNVSPTVLPIEQTSDHSLKSLDPSKIDALTQGSPPMLILHQDPLEATCRSRSNQSNPPTDLLATQVFQEDTSESELSTDEKSPNKKDVKGSESRGSKLPAGSGGFGEDATQVFNEEVTDSELLKLEADLTPVRPALRRVRFKPDIEVNRSLSERQPALTVSVMGNREQIPEDKGTHVEKAGNSGNTKTDSGVTNVSANGTLHSSNNKESNAASKEDKQSRSLPVVDKGEDDYQGPHKTSHILVDETQLFEDGTDDAESEQDPCVPETQLYEEDDDVTDSEVSPNKDHRLNVGNRSGWRTGSSSPVSAVSRETGNNLPASDIYDGQTQIYDPLISDSESSDEDLLKGAAPSFVDKSAIDSKPNSASKTSRYSDCDIPETQAYGMDSSDSEELDKRSCARDSSGNNGKESPQIAPTQAYGIEMPESDNSMDERPRESNKPNARRFSQKYKETNLTIASTLAYDMDTSDSDDSVYERPGKSIKKKARDNNPSISKTLAYDMDIPDSDDSAHERPGKISKKKARDNPSISKTLVYDMDIPDSDDSVPERPGKSIRKKARDDNPSIIKTLAYEMDIPDSDDSVHERPRNRSKRKARDNNPSVTKTLAYDMDIPDSDDSVHERPGKSSKRKARDNNPSVTKTLAYDMDIPDSDDSVHERPGKSSKRKARDNNPSVTKTLAYDMDIPDSDDSVDERPGKSSKRKARDNNPSVTKTLAYDMDIPDSDDSVHERPGKKGKRKARDNNPSVTKTLAYDMDIPDSDDSVDERPGKSSKRKARDNLSVTKTLAYDMDIPDSDDSIHERPRNCTKKNVSSFEKGNPQTIVDADETQLIEYESSDAQSSQEDLLEGPNLNVRNKSRVSASYSKQAKAKSPVRSEMAGGSQTVASKRGRSTHEAQHDDHPQVETSDEEFQQSPDSPSLLSAPQSLDLEEEQTESEIATPGSTVQSKPPLSSSVRITGSKRDKDVNNDDASVGDSLSPSSTDRQQEKTTKQGRRKKRDQAPVPGTSSNVEQRSSRRAVRKVDSSAVSGSSDALGQIDEKCNKAASDDTVPEVASVSTTIGDAPEVHLESEPSRLSSEATINPPRRSGRVRRKRQHSPEPEPATSRVSKRSRRQASASEQEKPVEDKEEEAVAESATRRGRGRPRKN